MYKMYSSLYTLLLLQSTSTEYLTDGLSVETNLDLLVDALESIAFKNTA